MRIQVASFDAPRQPVFAGLSPLSSACEVHIEVRCWLCVGDNPLGVLDHVCRGKEHLSGDWVNGFEHSQGVDD